jgi:hypothetical protein
MPEGEFEKRAKILLGLFSDDLFLLIHATNKIIYEDVCG